MNDARDYRRILALFLVSGALGLGYQVLWSKLVLLFVGVSSWSYAIVLAAFMAGLALGSRFLGSLADRVRSPLRLFAFLELGIGLCAVAYAPLSDAAGHVYLGLAGAGPGHSGGMYGLGIKAALAGLLLLPPTILMGGTYPAVVRHVSTSLAVVGRRASQLYAMNALGAVVGALGMAFLLLPFLGIRGCLMLMAMGNALVGLVALGLAGRRRERDVAAPAAAPDAGSPASAGEAPLRPREPLPGRSLRWLPPMMFVVGLLAFTYEIAWTRYFSLVVGSSTYSFAIIVAAFISGIAIAGAIVGRLEPRIRNPLLALGQTQIGAAALVLATLPIHPYLPWAFGRLSDAVPTTEATYLAYEGVKLLACWLVMLPAASLLGMSIPLAVMAVARDVRGIGSDAGRVYAWNTAGNVAGALLAGLVFLPWLGMEHLLRVTALTTAMVGVAAGAVALDASRSAMLRRLVLPAVAVIALALVVPAWNPAWFTLVPFRRDPMGGWDLARRTVASRTVSFFEDDPAANVIVMDETGPLGLGRALLVNGKPDASSTGDMPTQIVIGHLPCLLHGAPRDVLVVGLASGVTSGSVLRHAIDRLDVVDIVKAMPAASRLFDDWSGAPLDDPRTRFIADDARSYLSTTRQRYDVIISEPSNPWIAGTGSLFADEFYRRASTRLKPGGIYCQWLQAYEMADATLATIMATFRATFPHVAVFEVAAHDLVVLGSFEPLNLDPQAIGRGMTDRVREELAPLGIDDPVRLLYLQCYSQVTCDWLASLTGILNTDDNLLLEHEAPRDLFMRAGPTVIRRLDERGLVSPSLAWSRAVAAGSDPFASVRAMKGQVFGNSRIYTAALTALARSRGIDSVPAELHPPLPEGKRFQPMSGADAAAALRQAIAVRDWSEVRRIVLAEWSTLPHEALLSAASCEAWEKELAMDAPEAPPALRTALGLLRADVLAAGGRGKDALDQLVALAEHARTEDLVVRACRIDPGEACDAMVRRMASREPSEALDRFMNLRKRDGSELSPSGGSRSR